MTADRFDALKEEHKQCLRLVAQGYSSKQIARPLGLHHRTIDQRLDRARKLLDEPDRQAAARALVMHEARPTMYDAIICDPAPIVLAAHSPETSEATWGKREPHQPEVVRETSASVSFDFDHRLENAPARTGGHYELSPLQRLAIVVAILVGLTLAIIATPALHDSFQRIANSISPPTNPEGSTSGKEAP